MNTINSYISDNDTPSNSKRRKPNSTSILQKIETKSLQLVHDNRLLADEKARLRMRDQKCSKFLGQHFLNFNLNNLNL